MKIGLSGIVLTVFTLIGVCVGCIRRNLNYFYLFAALGVISVASIRATEKRPGCRQPIRLVLLLTVGAILFGYLSLHIGVNFQFPQIVFDMRAGIVTGALIQFAVARLFLPFVFGNAFCSRACWDGAVFELLPKKLGPPVAKMKPRSGVLAWSYVLILVTLALTIPQRHNPAADALARRWWIIGENVWIVGLGLLLMPYWGRRAYCRTLCPFLTVSRLISPVSLFKITPAKPDACVRCEQCNNACPMAVDVMDAVLRHKRISDRNCIMCERCVDACPNDCLRLMPARPTSGEDRTAKCHDG